MDEKSPHNLCIEHRALITQLEALCKKMDLRFEAIEKSILVAKSEMDRRLEGMNEFRAQLSKQAAEFISKKEVELLYDKLMTHFEMLTTSNREKITTLDKLYGERRGERKWSDYIITVIISIAVMMALHYMFKF